MCALATVAITAAPVAASARWCPTVTAGIATTISIYWVMAAAGFDMICRQLPDAFLALAILPIAMAAAVYVLQGSPSALSGIGYGAAVLAAPLVVAHLVDPAGLGFGDVKAGAVVGATLGLTLSAVAVASALVIALAIASVVGLSSRRRTIPLGPFMAVGAAVSLVLRPIVWDAS